MDNINKDSYKGATKIYDDLITHKTWWSKLILKFIYKDGNNNCIAKELLEKIPANFSGNILDVPVGTSVFVSKKYNSLKSAKIIGIDYSEEMLAIARNRLNENIELIKADVANLPFEDETFDIVFCMNGFHVFPNKVKSLTEITRVLKKDGMLLASCFVENKSILTDFILKKYLAKKGLVSLPFESECSTRDKLQKNFEIEMFKAKGTLIYYCAKKK